MQIRVNNQSHDLARYWAFHKERFKHTLAAIYRTGARRIVEVGGHPWAMTSLLVEDGRLNLVATISAEEVTAWPDDVGLVRSEYEIETVAGKVHRLINYSANIERTHLSIEESPDLVLACEVIEHLVRAPHIMMLNINQWLEVGGYVLVTTPNGAQFQNPFRTKTRTPPLRDSVYKRHNYLFDMEGLKDLLRNCGFEIVETDFWNVYPRTGLSRVYEALGALPVSYLRQKFRRTLYVLARKQENRSSSRQLPKVYAQGEMWDYMAENKVNSSSLPLE